MLRQGEQKDIGVQLKSSAGVSTTAVGFTPAENYSNIKVEFNPDKTNKSSFGEVGAPAPLRIVVPANAQVGPYTIPILVNISTLLRDLLIASSRDLMASSGLSMSYNTKALVYHESA